MSGGPDACWPWLSYCNEHGYGIWNPTEGKVVASRHAYVLTFGPLPDEIDACHRCDNPPCCNPRHLFPGTRKENMQDSIAKGRFKMPPLLRGEAHGMARATDEQVRYIRKLVELGQMRRGRCGRPPRGSSYVSMGQVATDLGLSWSAVNHIVAGRSWAHMESAG